MLIHSCLEILKVVVCIFGTWVNNCGVKHELGKYLKESSVLV